MIWWAFFVVDLSFCAVSLGTHNALWAAAEAFLDGYALCAALTELVERRKARAALTSRAAPDDKPDDQAA